MTSGHDPDGTASTPGSRRAVSPFEDPAVLAEITAILQRGYDRYLARQHAQRAEQERSRDHSQDGGREQRPDHDRRRDVSGDEAA